MAAKDHFAGSHRPVSVIIPVTSPSSCGLGVEIRFDGPLVAVTQSSRRAVGGSGHAPGVRQTNQM